MVKAAYFHQQTVACSLTLVKRDQRDVVAFLIGERAGAGVAFACWLFSARPFCGAVQVDLGSLFSGECR